MNKLLILFFLALAFGTSYDDAINAFESKNYKNALEIIGELIDRNDVNHEFHYLASKIYYAIGNLDNSNSSILQAIELKNDNKKYREYQKMLLDLKSGLKSAQKTFDSGYPEESVQEYNSLASKFSDSPIPSYSLGLIHLKTNNYKLAVENFNRAIDINPYEKEKYTKSIESISQRLAKSGDKKFKIKEYDEALALYLEAIDYKPQFSAVLYRITNVYQVMRDYENAKEFAERTLVVEPNHYKGMKTLGDIYIQLGDVNNSISFYNQSIAVNPEYYKAYYSLSKVLNDQGKSSDAIDNLNKALLINPSYDKAYVLLGVIYSANSQYEDAIYNFNKAIAINDRDYRSYGRLAETYNRSEQYEEAKEAAKKTLKIKRNYAGALFELGYAELYMCNKVASIDAFEKAKKDKNYRKNAKHYLSNIDKLFAKNCK